MLSMKFLYALCFAFAIFFGNNVFGMYSNYAYSGEQTDQHGRNTNISIELLNNLHPEWAVYEQVTLDDNNKKRTDVLCVPTPGCEFPPIKCIKN